MSWRLIVFDWDGTLMDSMARIVATAEAAIARLKYPTRSADQIRNIIGLGLKECWGALYPELSEDEYGEFVAAYRDCWRADGFPESTLYPGASDVLHALKNKGHALAVATGKGRLGLDRELKQTGTHDLFAATCTADESVSKPDPQMLESIMRETGVSPNQTLMVGDTEYDLEMARNARVDALAVSYGAHAKERLLSFGPLDCLDAIDELVAWLDGASRAARI